MVELRLVAVKPMRDTATSPSWFKGLWPNTMVGATAISAAYAERYGGRPHHRHCVWRSCVRARAGSWQSQQDTSPLSPVALEQAASSRCGLRSGRRAASPFWSRGFWISSDAIVRTYTGWGRPARLVEVIRQVPSLCQRPVPYNIAADRVETVWRRRGDSRFSVPADGDQDDLITWKLDTKAWQSDA